MSESEVNAFLTQFDSAHTSAGEIAELPQYFANGATCISDVLDFEKSKWSLACSDVQSYAVKAKEFIGDVANAALRREKSKLALSKDKTWAAIESKVTYAATTKDGTKYEVACVQLLVVCVENRKLKIKSIWMRAVEG